MRTRCPRCRTVFRVTPEQLRLKAGRVRCGHCQGVFNAFDSLTEEPLSAPEAEPAPPPPPEPIPPDPQSIAETPRLARSFEESPVSADGFGEEAQEEPAPAAALPEPLPAVPEPELLPEPEQAPAAPEPDPESPRQTPSLEESPAPEPVPELVAEAPAETPEASTEAARAAGLVAARELAEAPGYNRWAAGTLASSPTVGIAESRQTAVWPFVLAAIVLGIGLLLQAAHHFRTDVVRRLPGAAAAYAALGIAVPLPREAELVSIEASDLQADNARGLLVLQATLKNRAPYAQAWPVLELTLTDTHDAVVARRVLAAADYLPPRADPAAFAADSEIGLKLWLEARDAGAAGYRLYVFYP